MALTSLLVCADAKTVQVLSRTLSDLSIAVEHCGDPDTARARTTEERFDGLIIDCHDEAGAAALITHARQANANRSTIVVAIVSADNNVRQIFAGGANFVLYKPVTPERAATSMRAARSLMSRERRRNPRVPICTSATISYGTIEDASATLLDLSEHGVAIQTERRLPARCKVYFQFALPGRVPVIRLSGETTWQDSSGRAGIRFADVPQVSRRLLSEWLRENISAAEAKPPTPVAIKPRTSLLPSAPLVGAAGNRRTRARLACRLGAEVSRIGVSIPHRCSLTDVGTGGCYVETGEPFPSGTPVEIVVRAHDMKLRLRGTVQAVHQGFGMGVHFTVSGVEQKQQIQQLLDRQAQAELIG